MGLWIKGLMATALNVMQSLIGHLSCHSHSPFLSKEAFVEIKWQLQEKRQNITINKKSVVGCKIHIAKYNHTKLQSQEIQSKFWDLELKLRIF